MTLQMLVGCCLLAGPLPAALAQSPVTGEQRQTAAKPAQVAAASAAVMTREAEAYYRFMLGRHLESEGDVPGAIAAYNEAVRLDPRSAEILAELSALYARANRIPESIAAAEAALKLDSDNLSAHRMLGFIYADRARADEGTAPFEAGAVADASKAAEHLEAARGGLEVPDAGVEMLLGRIYLRSGAREKAIGILSRLVVDEPGAPEPVTLLAQAYQQAGRTGDAITLLEATADIQPQFYAALGELYEGQRKWLEAAGSYERAIARNPRNLELRMRLAVVLLSDGDDAMLGRALELLQQIRKENPADRRVLYLLSQAQRLSGQLDDAEATARQLMAVAPGSSTGAWVLAQVFGLKQQHRKVVETLEPIVGTPSAPGTGGTASDVLPMLFQLGLAYLELGEADRAISAFERARALSPGDPTIDIYIIQAHLTARRYAEAVALARKVRASQPDSLNVLRLEAEALRQSGKGDDGAALLADALAQHQDDVSAYGALAEFDAQRGQFAPALAVLARAAAKFPGDLSITFQTGSVFERQKRFAEAEQKFRDVLAKDPLHAQALNYLGYMLADRGERLDDAVGYIKRALQVDPYNGAYLDSLGWAYFRQNKLDLAETNLARAAEQQVRDSAIQDHFGDVLFKLGRYEEAASAWQRALDGDGEQVDRGVLEKKIRATREKVRKR
jgi:tetratricopeptide (TPR) repeat protein